MSCKSVSKAIGNSEVYLYKGQASYMDGTYFNDPYTTKGDFKLLTDIFNLNEHQNTAKVDSDFFVEERQNIEKVNFKFLDDEHLQITYTVDSKNYSKIIEGKMKNGAFRYDYKNLPLGIPGFFFGYQFKVHHIALGNDDNIIITEYDWQNTHLFFSIFKTTEKENRYYFDRQLK
jgi:hypothetical protein